MAALRGPTPPWPERLHCGQGRRAGRWWAGGSRVPPRRREGAAGRPPELLALAGVAAVLGGRQQ